jgi:4-hydroxybenzoate polyprenyltransferase
MTERTAKYVASVFAAVSAVLAPLAYVVDIRPLNATAVAGATLVLVYFAANPQLLVTPRMQWEDVSRRGTRVRIAFALGALLMIIGIVEAVVRSRAT